MKVDIDTTQEAGGGGAWLYNEKVPGWILWLIAIGLTISGVATIIGIPMLIYCYIDMKRAANASITWNVVRVNVEFTEEEKSIIKQHKLDKNTLVLEWDADDRLMKEDPKFAAQFPDTGNITMYSLTHSPFESRWNTPLRAKEFSEALKAKLPLVKDYIEGNNPGEAEDSSETLEF